MKTIIFGDVHLQSKSVEVILQYAKENKINQIYTLGDEGHKIYPFESGTQEENDAVFNPIRDYLKENKLRRLVAVVGDKTYYIPRVLTKYYQGVKGYKKIGPMIYHNDNIIIGHIGKEIIEEYGKVIKEWNNKQKPLLIFHGHSHSIGVLSDYVWLNDDDFVYFLEEDQTHYLTPGKVYWVNPGGNFLKNHNRQFVANFAIYDDEEYTIVLKSIAY